jgi:NAD-dependent epimerase/dehydratase family protein
MEVLVTGATGFVGANVARLLLANGYRRPRPGPSVEQSQGSRELRGQGATPGTSSSPHHSFGGQRLQAREGELTAEPVVADPWDQRTHRRTRPTRALPCEISVGRCPMAAPLLGTAGSGVRWGAWRRRTR